MEPDVKNFLEFANDLENGRLPFRELLNIGEDLNVGDIHKYDDGKERVIVQINYKCPMGNGKIAIGGIELE